MCGICISTKDKLRETLLNQTDRGLDSLWILNIKKYHKIIKDNYKWYKKFIKKVIKDEGLTIMHHRKASIWDVNVKNAHPFKWNQFYLMQNWTIRKFYNKYSYLYKKETDSENLLSYIEENVSSLDKVPVLLKSLSSELHEDMGIIILVDYKTKQILFYTDWSRESYIDIDEKNNKIRGIFNYKPWTAYWYENVGYIILDFEFNIIENTFTNLNKEIYILWISGVEKGKNREIFNIERQTTINEPYNWYYYNIKKEYYELPPVDGYKWLTADGKVEYADIVYFLNNDVSISNYYNTEQTLLEYIVVYYWLTLSDNYDEICLIQKRIKPVFDIAYNDAILWAFNY